VLSRQKILGGDMGREDAIHRLAASADTFAYPGDLLTRHTREGLVKDLGPFIEADSTFEAADFYPGLLEQFQWDGGTWALPAKVYPALIFYDQTAFEEAGLSPPRPGWTYEEFTQAAQQLTVREGERILRYGFINPSSDLALPLVLGRAGTWADESVAPLLPELDNAALAEAVEWYTDLALKHGVMPNPAEFDQQELTALIENGKAAMWTWYPTMHLKPGVVSPPEGKAIVNWKWASGYAVSAGTSHPQEAWDWLSFLAHQPLETGMESVSPRRSLSGQELDEGMKEVYDYVLNKPQVTLPADQSLVDPLLDALDSVLDGERRVDEALAEAQAQALALVQANAEEAHTPSAPIVVPTSRPQSQDEGTTITFCILPGRDRDYFPLAEEFHEQHPGINVDLIEVVEMPKGQTWAEGCDGFITHSGFGVVPSLERQHARNLQPFVDADPDLNLDDFYPQFLERFRREGDLWALPFVACLGVISYNKGLFDEAKVEYPQPGWTREDFLEKAVALTSEEGRSRIYGYLPLRSPPHDWASWLGLGVSTLVDTTVQPPRPQLDDSTIAARLQWYADLALVHRVMPILKEEEFRQMQTGDKLLDLVAASRVAMWSDDACAGQWLPASIVRIGVVSLPLEEQKVGMREEGVLGYMISADTAHPQACWEWIKFLSDHSAAVVRGLPARRSIAESPTYRSQVGEETAEALLHAVEHVDPSLDAVEKEYPWLIVLYYWLTEAYDRVLEGADIEDTLVDAQAKAEALLDCLGGNVASASIVQCWACAQEVDPEIEIPPRLRQE
jgi:ABC-type glycerol-3-phosphate transport system substrate-binding protein